VTESSEYIPPKVWTFDVESGGAWAKTNRPTSGATHEKKLPVGKHPLQLYSKGTPNGNKVTIMLEELLALGHEGAEYDAHMIEILNGDQFGSGFVDINPNSKIPALMDHSTTPPTRVFESGAILLYLAKKFGAFFPTDPSAQAECLSWLFWQVGTAAYLGGGFGHFYKYAPVKYEYPINRYTMEVKRQLDVLDKCLAENTYICGNNYTIADMAIWPWFFALVLKNGYNATEFLSVKSYTHVVRWAELIEKREAARRGRIVNTTSGAENEHLIERHDGSDFDAKDLS